MKKHSIYCFFAVLLVAVGCKDEPEQIPAYLDLQPFTVNEPGGAAWHKITEGWLYVNGEFLGAYTLPATVPVLAENESEVILFPGVKTNGIDFTPDIYPFFTRFETTVTLTPPGHTSIQPDTKYDPATIFPFSGRGDFDGASTLQFENRDIDAATGYVVTADGAFSGKSLQMAVDTAHWLIEIASEKVPLPVTAAKPVWLELTYKNDMPFQLYLLGTTGGSSEQAQAVYQFNNSENWNKIYINLTEFLLASLEEEYRLYFRTGLPRDDANKFSQINGTVYLDNIRLVHF